MSHKHSNKLLCLCDQIQLLNMTVRQMTCKNNLTLPPGRKEKNPPSPLPPHPPTHTHTLCDICMCQSSSVNIEMYISVSSPKQTGWEIHCEQIMWLKERKKRARWRRRKKKKAATCHIVFPPSLFFYWGGGGGGGYQVLLLIVFTKCTDLWRGILTSLAFSVAQCLVTIHILIHPAFKSVSRSRVHLHSFSTCELRLRYFF